MNKSRINIEQVESQLRQIQNQLCHDLEKFETSARFVKDQWVRSEGGGGESRVLTDGETFEKAGVNFSNIQGDKLPPSASARNPELAGRRYQALGVSVVIHPRNPMVPSAHMNVRFFVAENDKDDPIWWFGGGYDLTPFYGYDEDAVHWHATARKACRLLGDDHYAEYKKWCDEYFHIPHRNEQRGIGGLFFDDLKNPDFTTCSKFMQHVGESFSKAYCPIVERRYKTPYTDAQRQFQLYRRGRYVEFNLVYDRGTLFGLQSGGRVESILMSLPPLVRFDYGYHPEPASDEAKLYNYYLQPRDWLKGQK